MTCSNPEVRGGAIPLISLTAGGCPSRLRIWGRLFSIRLQVLFLQMIFVFMKIVGIFIRKVYSVRLGVFKRRSTGLPSSPIVLRVYGRSRPKLKQLSLLNPQNACWCASGVKSAGKSCMHMEFREAVASGARGSTGRLVSHVEVK